MSLLTIAYLLIAVSAVVVTIFGATQVKIHARIQPARIIFYLAIAALSLVLTLQQARQFADLVSGGFVVVMFLCFASWQKGLANRAIIGGLGSIRLYENLTAITLQKQPQGGTRLLAKAGSVVILRQRFRQSPETLAAFLSEHFNADQLEIE